MTSEPPEGSSRIQPLIEAIGPPLVRAPWSPDFAVQSIEILPVGLEGGRLFWLKPVHAPALQVTLVRGARPADQVIEAIAWYPLTPIVVHSTSWREVEDRVVLTYVAIVEPPANLPPNSLVALPVGRAELARGGSQSAPEVIELAAVLEHALRHLAWLLRDDAAIREALAGWTEVLAGYEPEPFRALA